jgi:hypothetical protein
MVYEVHITRAADWAQNQGSEILASEWHDLISRDPELRLTASNGPHFVVWNSNTGQTCGWLEWSNGNITAKSPNEQLLAKMLAIAEQLGAKVQGCDGELIGNADASASASCSSLFAGAPLQSFIASLVALFGLAGAATVDSLIRQQYAAGTPMSFAWVVALAALAVVGLLGWLTAAVLAVRSLVLRRPAKELAVAAIVVDVLAFAAFHILR